MSTVAHPNFAKFVDMLKNEDEFVRFKFLQEAAGKFSFPNKDFVKEDKLRMVVDCYKQFMYGVFCCS
jgi:hypothetical protein